MSDKKRTMSSNGQQPFWKPWFVNVMCNQHTSEGGFVVDFELHLVLCNVFFPTLLLTLQACLPSAELCTPHVLLFICKKYGKGSGKDHIQGNHSPPHALFRCPSDVYMLCLPLWSFAGLYGKAFGKYYKVGNCPPPTLCVSIWKSVPPLLICHVSCGLPFV